MTLDDLKAALGLADAGASLHALASRLYPLCRSITGDGVRETLAILKEWAPLEIHEVPSDSPALDWTVPKEWNCRAAWVKKPDGGYLLDFADHNLHVVGYSSPIHRKLPLSELRPRLHSLKDKPDLIPYRNTFFKEDWGFCLSWNQARDLPEGEYEVFIDSTLAPGSLTFGELVLPGKTAEEILFSAHVCHPSLANDNLSGIGIAIHLAAYLAKIPHRYTYRFVFAPVTVGAITYLSRRREEMKNVRHGLVLALLGDAGNMTYKRSREGNHAVDRAVSHVLHARGLAHRVIDFSPYGYDERQYGSPGFNLPVGCLMRTPHGEFPEYHTSGDNLSFIKPESLQQSLEVVLQTVSVLERNASYRNLSPYGEPQLGRRGVFRALADRTDGGGGEMALLWVLNQSDGDHSLLDIAEKSDLPFDSIRKAAELLQGLELIEEVR